MDLLQNISKKQRMVSKDTFPFRRANNDQGIIHGQTRIGSNGYLRLPKSIP